MPVTPLTSVVSVTVAHEEGLSVLAVMVVWVRPVLLAGRALLAASAATGEMSAEDEAEQERVLEGHVLCSLWVVGLALFGLRLMSSPRVRTASAASSARSQGL